MKYRIINEGDTMIVELNGEIDHHGIREVRESIDAQIDTAPPRTLALDMRGVSFMDSSGIGLVMGRYKIMSRYGGTVTILNPSPNIGRVLRLAGMDRLAKIEFNTERTPK